MVSCLYIPKVELAEKWPVAVPFLEKALTYSNGEYTLSDVFEQLLVGTSHLHFIYEGDKLLAVSTTQVIQYPQKSAIRIHLLGGEQPELWRDAFREHLAEGAKSIGAEQIEMSGRPGWLKFLKPLGKQTLVTVISEV